MAGRNIDHGIDQARTLYKRTMLTKDDCNFYCFTHKMGESVLRGEGDDSYYKVDLCVNFKARENKYDCLLLSLLKTRIFLLLEGNAMISNLKKYHLKPELALLQGAGNEADILMMKAIDENFTVASRPTKALSISDNLASDKLIFLYNCFLQYKFLEIWRCPLVQSNLREKIAQVELAQQMASPALSEKFKDTLLKDELL
ncbi:hypothetical protein BDC45DRAFT_533843 [Circinella umbellata]|nr:hypothetical protein BDC45DRAFT_533843 [Circinella umbellata]